MQIGKRPKDSRFALLYYPTLLYSTTFLLRLQTLYIISAFVRFVAPVCIADTIRSAVQYHASVPVLKSPRFSTGSRNNKPESWRLCASFGIATKSSPDTQLFITQYLNNVKYNTPQTYKPVVYDLVYVPQASQTALPERQLDDDYHRSRGTDPLV